MKGFIRMNLSANNENSKRVKPNTISGTQRRVGLILLWVSEDKSVGCDVRSRS